MKKCVDGAWVFTPCEAFTHCEENGDLVACVCDDDLDSGVTCTEDLSSYVRCSPPPGENVCSRIPSDTRPLCQPEYELCPTDRVCNVDEVRDLGGNLSYCTCIDGQTKCGFNNLEGEPYDPVRSAVLVCEGSRWRIASECQDRQVCNEADTVSCESVDVGYVSLCEEWCVPHQLCPDSNQEFFMYDPLAYPDPYQDCVNACLSTNSLSLDLAELTEIKDCFLTDFACTDDYEEKTRQCCQDAELSECTM